MKSMPMYLSEASSQDEMIEIIKKLPTPFEIKEIVFLNEGYDNIAVEVNGEWIFRFPKKPDVPMEKEIQLLNFFKGKFHLKIPEIECVFQNPRGVCYRKILGTELTSDILQSLSVSAYEKLVDDMAQFFVDMHSAISIEEARSMGVQEDFYAFYLQLIRERILPVTQDASVLAFAKHALQEYKNLSSATCTHVLHFDVSGDNIAFDPEKKQLNGVFDFSDLSIGDVNFEFVHLLHFDAHFTKSVTDAYTKKTGIVCDLRRTRIYLRINVLADLAYLSGDPESSSYKSRLRIVQNWIDHPEETPQFRFEMNVR